MTPPEHALTLLRTMFGPQADFRPGQWESIQNLLVGHHTLTVMPTGAGKSLIFQLAALLLGAGLRPAPTALVISPLIALMKDQVDSLVRRNIPAMYINSALPAAEQASRLENLAQGKFRLVYVAPERLRSVQFLHALRSQKISLELPSLAHVISTKLGRNAPNLSATPVDFGAGALLWRRERCGHSQHGICPRSARKRRGRAGRQPRKSRPQPRNRPASW